MTRLDLDGVWQLTYAEGRPRSSADQFIAETVHGREFFPTHVPEPVHSALERSGLIDAPEYGLNSLACRWVETCTWIYRREFELGGDAQGCRAYLRFACLDMDATVYVNGVRVGTHQNSHRPVAFDVSGRIRRGTNLVVVTVDSGYHRTANADRDQERDHLVEVTKSKWLRRPQYQAGWDWSPHLLAIGILGSVELICTRSPVVWDLRLAPRVSPELDHAVVDVHLRLLGGAKPERVTACLQLQEGGPVSAPASTHVELDGGELGFSFPIDRPRLWWPWEFGPQHMYDLRLKLQTEEGVERLDRRIGLRRVDIEQAEHPEGGRTFRVMVNGEPIFCKGANWVPPSLFPSTVHPSHYPRLIALARESNMNMLRVWGGGTWLPEAALAACDEAGIGDRIRLRPRDALGRLRLRAEGHLLRGGRGRAHVLRRPGREAGNADHHAGELDLLPLNADRARRYHCPRLRWPGRRCAAQRGRALRAGADRRAGPRRRGSIRRGAGGASHSEQVTLWDAGERAGKQFGPYRGYRHSLRRAMVRDGELKHACALTPEPVEPLLTDLQADPLEVENYADDPAYAERAAELRSMIGELVGGRLPQTYTREARS